MKDLDFDEIDQAVNSIKSGIPAANNDTGTSTPPVNSVQSTVSVGPSPTVVGRRSSGQFMDVVHPSSDMRKTSLMMPNRATNQNTADSNPPVTPIAPAPLASPDRDSVSSIPASSDIGMPDPIDYRKPSSNVTESRKDTNPDQNEDADIDRISDDITNELSQKSDESPDSPFISGTKVEKRPLGAFSTESTDQTTEPEDKKDSTDKDKANTEVKPTGPDAPLPEELQDDLLLIESGNSSTNSDTPITKDSYKDTVKASAAESQPIGPSSITQQYKEQPSTGDQSTGAIYDTDAYHKALARPSKKKSGWLWVLWITILLVVGAGAGAAVYFYAIPH